MHVNRREFLRKSICAALGGASLYSALGNLRLIGAAAAAQRPSGFSDYKALVCIFMYGGNDSFNTIVPMSGQDQVDYLASRGDLAITTGLQALTPASGGGPANYGLHPAMPEIAGLFNSGKAAIVANVGSLLVSDHASRVSRTARCRRRRSSSRTTIRPTSGRPRARTMRTRTGGAAASPTCCTRRTQGQVPMSITLSGQNRFQRGAVVNQFSVDSWGASCAATRRSGLRSVQRDDDELSRQRPGIVAARRGRIRTSSPTTSPRTTR